jgi:dipeptidyl aminopeptidase/acylaminoacyl peptidase
MDLRSTLNRRKVMKWGLLTAAAPAVARLGVSPAAAQYGPATAEMVVGGRDETALFPGDNLPGGAQMEIRMVQSMHTEDPDELEVAHRAKPFDMDSWYTEWARVAEKNEQMAEAYAADGLRESANEFYLRASRFWREANYYLPDTYPHQLSSYRKYRETFDKAWEMVPPPFERVTVTVQGRALPGYFRKPRGAAGQRFPVVIGFQGADSMAENTIMGGASGFVARGMAYFVMDFPGQGGAQRLENMYLPPNTETMVAPVIDYLVARPDIDASRIALHGISMGGFSAPRAAAAEKRISAVMAASASYDLLADLFDYYPPIQDRVRWIIGAKTLQEARSNLAEYNLASLARQIECPMLLGYGPTDRIMDPQGAFRLYEAATNSQREMWAGGGHPHHAWKAGGPRTERLPLLQDWAMRTLRAES